MNTLPPCPACKSELTYEDGAMLVCPECAHEWSADAVSDTEEKANVRLALNTRKKPVRI